jgi:hypothetical protein
MPLNILARLHALHGVQQGVQQRGGARFVCDDHSMALRCRERAPSTTSDSDIRGARQQPHQQLIDHGHVECIERPPASASGLHTLRSLYH